MKKSLYIITFIALTLLLACNQDSATNSKNKVDTYNNLELKIAGYDYDRVSAIRDGKVSIEDANVNFEVSNIYALNKSAFGPEQKYEVTEI